MSDRGFPAADAYPERQDRRPSAVEKALRALAYLPQRALARPAPPKAVARQIEAAVAGALDPQAQLRQLRYDLRQAGLRRPLVLRALGLLARECAARLGRKPSATELAAAFLLVRGDRCVQTPETAAWPLAVGLAAATVALGGLPVHVIFATGHLARRDAEALRPLFEAAGLSVGIVEEGMPDADRRSAYAADIAYCVHRIVALDYLRDRLVLKGRPRALRLRTEVLTSSAPRMRQVMLRGLQCAIVCEAETVLVDAAQWPVTITADAADSQEVAWLTQALTLARALAPGEDFRLEPGSGPRLTETGQGRLAAAARRLAGHWQGARRREEIVRLALVAELLLQRDEHYGVSGKNLQAADELLRPHAPDAGSRRLLTMLLEIKESCNVTGTREVTARIGYQRFFRRYLRCAALAAEAGGLGPELWSMYGLRLARLPGTAPALRVTLPDRLEATLDAAAASILARVRELHAQGIPVLIVTRTPQAAAAWAEALKGAGIECRRLTGVQNDEEARLFREAGHAGAVTVAPHYAARGVQVEAVAAVASAGGLRIVLTQLLAASRHEAALAQRCIAAGTPGSIQRVLAADDELLAAYVPGWLRRLGRRFPLPLLGFCQWRAGREFAHARNELFRTEEYLGDVLAFSGGSL
jgi:preprotein translocase subunit SecA